jgi:hypothetical protein
MPDPTIPELVARLRELHNARRYPTETLATAIREDQSAQVYATSTGPMRAVRPVAETTVDHADLIAETLNALPTLLDALERQGSHLESLTTWLPIEECGELEAGAEYLVRMKHAATEALVVLVCELITIARWSGAEWQVRIGDAERYYYRADHITHVHRMGPIRGPGDGER